MGSAAKSRRRAQASPASSTSSDEAQSWAYVGLLACFVLSGFAALVYQTAWMRQFSIVLGTSGLAVAMVLATYMGGLALGAALASRFVARIRRPVLVYGVLELGVALGALAVPLGFAGARWTHAALLGGQPEPPGSGGVVQPLFYLGCAFVILAVPTACMGATLPVLTRFAVRRQDQVGARAGLLYASNTAGAVAGTLVAAFVLLPQLGLRGTVWVGVGVNALVFLIAAWTARGAGRLEPDSSIADGPDEPTITAADDAGELDFPDRARWVLPLMLISGAAAFVHEVLWTRLLSHLVGGTVFAFATMLSSFLGGIAIGSAVASRLATDRRRAARGLAAAQVGAALMAAVVYILLDSMPQWSSATRDHRPASVLLALVAMLPATLFIGATFPFALRLLTRNEGDAAASSGRLYAWNTVGAIVGALLAGFLLIPTLEFGGTALLAAGVNVALGLACLTVFVRPARRSLMFAAATSITALLIVFGAGEPERLLRTSALDGHQQSGREVFSAVGRSASVQVLERNGLFHLRTNGLEESAIARPGAPSLELVSSYRLLAALPLLARPRAESMLVVGFGGGTTLEEIPATVTEIDVIELEPTVIEAARALASERAADPLADPRVEVIFNDARSALALTSKRYDLVVSQPSHPWTAGASHLYTREFAELVRAHLNPEGVFVEWMGARYVDEELVRILGATLLDVFAHVRLYQPTRSMLVFLASDDPLELELELARSGEPIASARRYFARLAIGRAEDVACMLTLDSEGLAQKCAASPIATDDRNWMAMRSSPTSSAGVGFRLDPALDPLTRPDSPFNRGAEGLFDRGYLAARISGSGSSGRAQRAARVVSLIEDASERTLAQGFLQFSAGQEQAGIASLQEAWELDQSNTRALYAILRPALQAYAAGEASPEVLAMAQQLDDPGAAVFEASRLWRQMDFIGMKNLDGRLAAADSSDPCYFDAVTMRTLWRGLGFPGDGARLAARQSLQIIDRAYALRTDDPTLALDRLQAALKADEPAAVLGTLEELTSFLDGRRPNQHASVREAVRETLAGSVQQSLAELTDDDRVSNIRVHAIRDKINGLLDTP